MTKRRIDEQGRPEPAGDADEATTLRQFLDYQRATFEWKCGGLTDEQLRATLHPTALTLAGLMAHLATVEDFWFATVVAEQPFPEDKYPPNADNAEWEWTAGAQLPGGVLRPLWQASIARSNAVLDRELADAATALAATHQVRGNDWHVSLRWVLAHMIEEYARHNGHADLLRESIDGETGE